MISKINCLSIVKDHLGCFYINEADPCAPRKLDYSEVFLFFVSPLLLGILLITMDIRVSRDVVNYLAASFSIFSALLLNLMIIVLELARKTALEISNSKDQLTSSRLERRRRLLCEVNSSIAFEILLSIVALALSFGLMIPRPKGWDSASHILDGATKTTEIVLITLVGIFLLTLLMLLKRVYTLMSGEFTQAK